MGKPTGITADLRIKKPSRAENAVWRAVEEAVMAGWSAKRLRREIAEAWKCEKEDQLKREMKTLTE